jgi:MFS family permease
MSAIKGDTGEGYLYSKRHAYFVLVVLSALMAFDFLDRQVIAALLPAIKAEWLLSDTQLGALIAVLNLAIALFALPAAILSDRWSRTRSAGIMALLWSLATISCGLAGSYLQLLVARFTVGVGEAGYIAPGNSLIAASFPKRQRGTMIAIFQSAGPIGSVIGVVLGGLIAAKWGWRYAFGLVAIPGILLAGLIFFAKDYPTVMALPQTDRGENFAMSWRDAVISLFKQPKLAFIFVGTALQFFVVATMGNWLPSYFNRYYGLSISESGVRAGLFVLSSAVGLFLAGWISDELGQRNERTRVFLPVAFSAGTGIFL